MIHKGAKTRIVALLEFAETFFQHAAADQADGARMLGFELLCWIDHAL